MIENAHRNRAMAFAVVAMFMLSACALCLEGADAEEYGTGPYTINMRVGDTFSYEPSSNLDGTTFSWVIPESTVWTTATTHNAVDGVKNEAELEFKPTEASTSFSITLNANWYDTGDSTDYNLHQDAYQTLNFHIYERLTFSETHTGAAATVVDSASAISATASASLIQGLSDDQEFTFAVSGGLNPKFASPTIEGTNANLYISTDYVLNETAGELTVTVDNEIPAGTYTVTMPASYSIEGAADATAVSQNKSIVFTIIVGDGMVIAPASGNLFTVIGSDSLDELEFEVTAPAGIDDTSIVWSTTKTSDNGWVGEGKGAAYFNEFDTETSLDKLGYTITLPTSGFSNTDITGQVATIGLTVGVTADDSNSQQVTAQNAYTLKVYRSLMFTTSPVLEGSSVSVMASSMNGLDVLITSTVEGANKLVYSWGDGTTYTRELTSGTNTYYTANHTYAKSGTYFIQITASNDFGETTYVTPYTTTGAIIEWDSDKAVDMTGIKATEAEDGTELVLEPIVVMTKGNSISYKWTYTDGDSVREITPAEKPAWVKSVTEGGSKLTVFKKGDSTVPDNTKLTCTATVSFSGETEPATASASYTYHGEGNDNWTWILSFVAITVMCVAGIVFFGPDMILLVVGGFSSIAALVMLVSQLFF